MGTMMGSMESMMGSIMYNPSIIILVGILVLVLLFFILGMFFYWYSRNNEATRILKGIRDTLKDKNK